MPTPLELNSTGLSIQTQQEIFEELVGKLQAIFGTTLTYDLSSIVGQICWIFAELRALDQQTLLDVYRSFDPNGAYGTALDARGALTGSVRKGATNSTVEGFIEFSGPGTVVNGALINNDDMGTQWEFINGPYTDTGGPYPELVAAQVQAVDVGPLYADAGTTWSIVTPSLNFAGFTNPVEDATLGRFLESDPDFRLRRTIELFAQGQGPLSTINAIVSGVDTENGQVSFVRTYHNPDQNPVDADGIPFKAFNVVVETIPSPPPLALQQDIFDAILTATGAGGYAFGTDYTGTAVDTEGQPHSVAFDLVQLLDVYMQVELTTGEGAIIPADQLQMATLVRDACVTAANTSFTIIGRDMLEIDYIGAIQRLLLTGQISGIANIVVRLSDVSKLGPYTSPVLPIGIRQKIDLDAGEVRVLINGNVIIA